jgi:hypothetical protein
MTSICPNGRAGDEALWQGVQIEELDRRAKVEALDTYLASLEAELGPVSPEEAAAATAWADRVLGTARPA